MAGYGCVMFGWSWIEKSVLVSQVFGQASVEGCDMELGRNMENARQIKEGINMEE